MKKGFIVAAKSTQGTEQRAAEIVYYTNHATVARLVLVSNALHYLQRFHPPVSSLDCFSVTHVIMTCPTIGDTFSVRVLRLHVSNF